MTANLDVIGGLPAGVLFAFCTFLLSGVVLLVIGYRKSNRRSGRLQHRLAGLSTAGDVVVRDRKPAPENSFLYVRDAKFQKWRQTLRARFSYMLAGMAILLAVLYLIALASAVVATVIFASLIAILGLVLAVLLFRQKRQTALYTAQLPEAIDIIIRGARVGMSLQENFRVIGSEMPAPLGHRFRIISEKLGIGIDLETALKSAQEEIRIKEFQFMSTTLILQRQSGGHYAEVLENLNQVLRERRAQFMKARALTSEARASARIVSGVVGLILLILALTNARQFQFLLHDPTGQNLLLYSGISIGAGFFIISRLLRTLR
ncbi:type II secretion system F family protein [Sneathiella sp.]|uniref:type II secretion system F family protein n=1 Tax=Sneathiella sp. TaxID=1964365 RepID=UPI003566B4EC